MASELRVGTDASGGACWEVEIDGVCHQSRRIDVLRELIRQNLNQKPIPIPFWLPAPPASNEGSNYETNSEDCVRYQILYESIDH